MPAAVSTGIGSQVQRPLATVVVGGMLVGPIKLVVVPALQLAFLRKRSENNGDGNADNPLPERDF